MVDLTTLNVRTMPVAIATRIHRTAAARGLTIAQYLAQLVALHDQMRARADAGDDAVQAEMVALGLQTIHS